MAAEETLPNYCGDLSTIRTKICLKFDTVPACNTSSNLIITFNNIFLYQSFGKSKCTGLSFECSVHMKPPVEVGIGMDFCCHLEVLYLTHYGSLHLLYFKMSADFYDLPIMENKMRKNIQNQMHMAVFQLSRADGVEGSNEERLKIRQNLDMSGLYLQLS